MSNEIIPVSTDIENCPETGVNVTNERIDTGK